MDREFGVPGLAESLEFPVMTDPILIGLGAILLGLFALICLLMWRKS